MMHRRTVLKGIAGLPLAAVLADPMLARAVAATLETVETTTAGGKTVGGALAMPAETPAPAVILIHEWWGLNDQIKSAAAEFANQGYLTLAVDLMDGKVATSPDEARALTQAVQPAVATETMVAWVEEMRKHPASNGKVAVIGWCFGGGWALNTAIAAPVDATVIYYGRVNKTPEELASLEGPVLGHFATKDQSINKPMVEGFEAAMKAAGKPYEIHWYEADHAFANPTGARYDEADAKLAWERTMAFLKETL